jgi:hypothetical protein
MREVDDRLRRKPRQAVLEQLGLRAGVVACGAARLLDQLPERTLVER